MRGGGQDEKSRTLYTLLAVFLLMDVCCTVVDRSNIRPDKQVIFQVES